MSTDINALGMTPSGYNTQVSYPPGQQYSQQSYPHSPVTVSTPNVVISVGNQPLVNGSSQHQQAGKDHYHLYRDPRILLAFFISLSFILLSFCMPILIHYDSRPRSFKFEFAPYSFFWLVPQAMALYYGTIVVTSFPQRSKFIPNLPFNQKVLIPSSTCNQILRLTAACVSVVVTGVWGFVMLIMGILSLSDSRAIYGHEAPKAQAVIAFNLISIAFTIISAIWSASAEFSSLMKQGEWFAMRGQNGDLNSNLPLSNAPIITTYTTSTTPSNPTNNNNGQFSSYQQYPQQLQTQAYQQTVLQQQQQQPKDFHQAALQQQVDYSSPIQSSTLPQIETYHSTASYHPGNDYHTSTQQANTQYPSTTQQSNTQYPSTTTALQSNTQYPSTTTALQSNTQYPSTTSTAKSNNQYPQSSIDETQYPTQQQVNAKLDLPPAYNL